MHAAQVSRPATARSPGQVESFLKSRPHIVLAVGAPRWDSVVVLYCQLHPMCDSATEDMPINGGYFSSCRTIVSAIT